MEYPSFTLSTLSVSLGVELEFTHEADIQTVRYSNEFQLPPKVFAK